MSSKPRLLLAAGSLLALTGALLAGRSQSDVQVHAVAGKVSYLVGRGGNIGISAGPDGVLMIDDQFADWAARIEAAIDTLSDAEPRLLVNTHHHGDHVGGNAHFGKRATILAHENVRARLAGDSARSALPVVTYDDGVTVHFNGEEIRLIHVPGAHTDGDTIVWFTGSNVFHLGDCYFQLGYPFIDTNSGGNVLGMIAAVKHVLHQAPEDALFIPGHGELTGREGLEEYLDMLTTLTERVRTHLDQGDDVDAMMQSGVTEDHDERWGGFSFVPPRRFVESVATSLRAR